ncbi:MAG TPA: hypothetical protein VGD40_22740 [Chryseosolibacter sp.]
MKKILLILGGIALLCFLLIVRSFYRQKTRMDEEREWFVKGVAYEFTARVDSVQMLNENMGRLRCLLLSGDPKEYREDSLKAHFKEHDMLYLIYERSKDTITFLFPSAKPIMKGDSVSVSSQNNAIRFFRNGNELAKDELTNALTGFGRPFFLKKKK